jgi:chloramphenicol-sensitive protein RarD
VRGWGGPTIPLVSGTAVSTSTFAPLVQATPQQRRARAGFLYAMGAYLAWGGIPTFFKLLAHVPPLVVLGHRIVWSVLFLGLLLTLTRKWDEVRAAVRSRRTLTTLLCSTALIAVNWYVFIWAFLRSRP